MIDYTQTTHDFDCIKQDFSDMPELHANEDTLNFIRFFACNYKPLAGI